MKWWMPVAVVAAAGLAMVQQSAGGKPPVREPAPPKVATCTDTIGSEESWDAWGYTWDQDVQEFQRLVLNGRFGDAIEPLRGQWATVSNWRHMADEASKMPDCTPEQKKQIAKFRKAASHGEKAVTAGMRLLGVRELY